MTPVRRILVAVDASRLSLAAVDAAAALARRMDADIEAVFVEDVNVLRLVAHPFIHTFSLSAIGSRDRDDALLEKAMELQVLAARRALDHAAARHAVRAVFNVRRGLVAAELLAAAGTADLVCLGWSGRAEPGLRPRLGANARAVMTSATRPVMVVRRALREHVAAWWDGTEASGRALMLAGMLASAGDCMLDLFVPSTALAAEASGLLAEAGVTARLSGVGGAPEVFQALGPDCLLVASAESGLSPEMVPCSMVVVR